MQNDVTQHWMQLKAYTKTIMTMGICVVKAERKHDERDAKLKKTRSKYDTPSSGGVRWEIDDGA